MIVVGDNDIYNRVLTYRINDRRLVRLVDQCSSRNVEAFMNSSNYWKS